MQGGCIVGIKKCFDGSADSILCMVQALSHSMNSFYSCSLKNIKNARKPQHFTLTKEYGDLTQEIYLVLEVNTNIYFVIVNNKKYTLCSS